MAILLQLALAQQTAAADASADGGALLARDGQGDGKEDSSKPGKDTGILALEDQDKGSKESGRATGSQEIVVASDALVQTGAKTDMSG